MKNHKWIFIFIISVLSQGCLVPPRSEVTQVVDNEMGTNLATSYIPIAVPLLPTEIPTLPFNEAREQSTELLQNNNNCKLPCWWGITPGQTTWQDAFLILAPLGGEISESMAELNENDSIYVRPPAPDNEHKVLFQPYYFEDNVVTTIEVYNYDYAPVAYFKKLISEYGIPEEMYMSWTSRYWV